MDAIDRQIVAMLRANARLPLKTLAATVGLARSSVRERLSKLEAAGTIGGYHARIVNEGGIAAILQLRLARTPSPDIVAAITGMARTSSEKARYISSARSVSFIASSRSA